jgi:hypothetical protein
MNLRQRLVTVAIAGLALAGTTAVVTSPADAAIPHGSCGSGYHLKGTKSIKAGSKTIGYLRWYMKVYRTDSPSRICAITSVAANYVGKTRKVGVSVDGAANPYQEANFKYYAGPVHTSVVGPSAAVGWIYLKKGAAHRVFFTI